MEPPTIRSGGDASAAAVGAAFVPRAPGLVRLLVAGIAGALPHWRCKDICDILWGLLVVSLRVSFLSLRFAFQVQTVSGIVIASLRLQSMGQQGVAWIAAAVGALPDVSATASDRQKLYDVLAATAVQAFASGSTPGFNNTDATRCCTVLCVLSASKWRSAQVHNWLFVGIDSAPHACRRLEDAMEELSDLCRRNRNSYESAQLALLPPKLLQESTG